MFLKKSSLGEEVPITNTNVFTHCPKCGVEHKVDLVSLITEHGEDSTGNILDSTMYCEKCTKPHLPMYEHMEENEAVAARFPGASVEQVQEIVRSDLDHGFFFETVLVGARLAYAMQTWQEELFSLDDVAAALGCTKEEAATRRRTEQRRRDPLDAAASLDVPVGEDEDGTPWESFRKIHARRRRWRMWRNGCSRSDFMRH